MDVAHRHSILDEVTGRRTRPSIPTESTSFLTPSKDTASIFPYYAGQSGPVSFGAEDRCCGLDHPVGGPWLASRVIILAAPEALLAATVSGLPSASCLGSKGG